MQSPLPSKRPTWGRVIVVTAGSIFAFLVAHRMLLKIFPDGGRLSESGGLMANLIANLWSAAYFSWLSTGHFIPHADADILPQAQHSTMRSGFLGSPFAITLLSIVWLGIWLYVTLLNDSFRAELFDGKNLDIALSNDEAMRISKTVIGLLSLGITFPLLAASAFIVGWACSSPLRFRTMLIPATAFCVTAAILNYGAEVLRTGRPPLYEVIQLVLRSPGGQPTPSDLAIIWFINLVVFPVGPLLFAGYGRIWTFIGFSLRRAIARNEG